MANERDVLLTSNTGGRNNEISKAGEDNKTIIMAKFKLLNVH